MSKKFTFLVSSEVLFSIQCDAVQLIRAGNKNEFLTWPDATVTYDGIWYDPVTGIKTQKYVAYLDKSGIDSLLPVLTFSLQTKEGQPYFLATNLNGARQVKVVVGPDSYPHP